MTIEAWTSAPPRPSDDGDLLAVACGASSCEHALCEVALTGGEALCRLAGGSWADLSQPARDHYAAIAMAAFVLMWERAVVTGMTVEAETVEDTTDD